jgi:hypothetical protein
VYSNVIELTISPGLATRGATPLGTNPRFAIGHYPASSSREYLPLPLGDD